MVDGKALPEPGAILVLRRLDIEMRGVVVWRAEGRCGIQFEGAASVDEWVAGRRSPVAIFGQGQSRVDQIQAAVRSGRDIVDDNAAALGSTEIITDVEARVADELDHVQRLLDDVAADLIGDAGERLHVVALNDAVGIGDELVERTLVPRQVRLLHRL